MFLHLLWNCKNNNCLLHHQVIPAPSLHRKFLSEFGSRKSSISLGKVVSFLFSDQNDLCDLSHVPLSLVCQEDYSWSFHSVSTTRLIVIFWIFTFFLLFPIKNLSLLIYFFLPFTKFLISFWEMGRQKDIYLYIYYINVCMHIYIYIFMHKYFCLNFYLKVWHPSLSSDISNFFNPATALFPLFTFPSYVCPTNISWCLICWILRWGRLWKWIKLSSVSHVCYWGIWNLERKNRPNEIRVAFHKKIWIPCYFWCKMTGRRKAWVFFPDIITESNGIPLVCPQPQVKLVFPFIILVPFLQ